jgi:8-amino-7-oxononanoate synthase
VGAADSWAAEELRRQDALGLRRELEPIDSPQGAEVRICGRTLINFCSNDYLGLASHPALIDACAGAARSDGVGAGASRLLAGDTAAHHALERALSLMMGSKHALLFNTGFAANTGTIPALVGPSDAIYSDELNHASLIDGCRLSGAEVMVYPHADLSALERLLRKPTSGRRLVCTEAVFSMDGDRAPVRGLVELCRVYDAALLVDEAHALGVIGPGGAGLCAEEGIAGAVDVRIGTLGKALGAFGAFAATSANVAALLINRARTLIYSTALPPPICAAAIAAIGLASAGELQRKLAANAERFASGLVRLGFRGGSGSAIFPVVLGNPERALAAAAQLRAKGFLVKAIRPPTVPQGTSRLRFSICTSHTHAQIDGALEALKFLER